MGRSGRIVALLILALAAPCSHFAAQTVASDITLQVNAREAPRSLFHVTERVSCAPGVLKLFYPKYIPGEHGPTGPLNSVIGFRITAEGKPLAWKRDLVDMFEIDTTVPNGVREVEIDFDQTYETGGFFGESGSATLSRIKWNRLVWYPGPAASDSVMVTPSITLPAAWSIATALDLDKKEGDTFSYKPVSLTRLVDSPAEIGKYFERFDVTGTSPVRHTLDVVAESPSAIRPSPEMLQDIAHIHEEVEAIAGGRHYNHYDWLLTLSDIGGSDGLEHHESSEDGVFESTLVEPDYQFDLADLLSHEYFHSYNGKFRRPAGLATADFDAPMKDDLLWVYEGLTQFYGHVIPRRAGFWDDEKWRDVLALDFHTVSMNKGREWRPLSDTADAAQILYGSSGPWSRSRRGVDFYTEMVDVWLEVHSIIGSLTNGQKGIDDFVREFHGGPSNGPELKTYNYADVTATLARIAPYDWDGFFKKRVYSLQPELSTAAFETLGWRITYNSTPNPVMDESGLAFGGPEGVPVDLSASIGLIVRKDAIDDVVSGTPADKAGLMPEAKIIAVNGRAYSADVLKEAVADTTKGIPVELLVNNKGVIETFKLDYKGGLRYPHLERIPGKPDLLTPLGAPRRQN
jgi:predicted metalloprotease with PDZ domain